MYIKLSPVLSAMINVQNFNCFSFYRIHNDVWKGRERQFPGTAELAWSADVWASLDGTDAPVYGPHDRLCIGRIALLKIILDVF
jgi:hypothetical protein